MFLPICVSYTLSHVSMLESKLYWDRAVLWFTLFLAGQPIFISDFTSCFVLRMIVSWHRNTFRITVPLRIHVGGSPHTESLMRSFDIVFVASLNIMLNTLSRYRWFTTPWPPWLRLITVDVNMKAKTACKVSIYRFIAALLAIYVKFLVTMTSELFIARPVTLGNIVEQSVIYWHRQVLNIL